MNERRRAVRSQVHLLIELKRSDWEQHVTGDASRRGMFIRLVGPCQVGQLLQLQIRLPGDSMPLTMLGRVVRRCTIADSLAGGDLPGMGLEFFCLDAENRRRWEHYLSGGEQGPGLRGVGTSPP